MLENDDILTTRTFLGLYTILRDGEKDPEKKRQYEPEIFRLESKITLLRLQSLLLHRKRETNPTVISRYDEEIAELQEKMLSNSKSGIPMVVPGQDYMALESCKTFVLKGLLGVNLEWREQAQNDPKKVRQFDGRIGVLQDMLRAQPQLQIEEDQNNNIVMLGGPAVILDGWDTKTLNGLLALNALWRTKAKHNSEKERKHDQTILWLRHEYTRFMDPQPYYGA